ncbi:hypothetical protein WDW89_14820 [Deltaproteobacteria bacterium TL4]
MDYVRFFRDLLKLSKDDRYSISTLFFKLIYADSFVHQKEIPYVSDIFDLLENDPMLIASAKDEAIKMSVDTLPAILLGPRLTKQLLRCLLEITMCDGDFDYREFMTIRAFVNKMGYEPVEFEKLVLDVAQKYKVKLSASLF